MHRQRPVEDGAGGRRPFHGARQPAGERNQRRLARRRDEQQQADEQRLVIRQRGLAFRPRPGAHQSVEVAGSGKMMHGDRGDQERRIGQAIHAPHANAIPHRPGTLVEERDQQRRRQTDQFPAQEQHFDRSRQGSDDHSQREQGIADKEPAVSGLAVQIAAGECPDRAAQQERQDHKRHGEPVEDELQMKVKMLLRNDDPVAQFDRHVLACPGPASCRGWRSPPAAR